MKSFFRIAAAAIVILVPAAAAMSQEKPKSADAAMVKDLESAMTPGEAQKRLGFMVGTFDVKVRTWVDPSKPPVESAAASVGTWVLGDRFVQNMLSGFVEGQAYHGIGYAGFDNVSKKYVATYMDDGGTGMEWYTGTMDASGNVAKLTATINDALTGKPVPVEMRLSVAANGDHVTELWTTDAAGKMAKVMELQYTRKKS